MSVYYNEFNKESAAMIRQFMVDGLIPEGDIDTRSITEVTPDDLKPYTQCHFFAGIAGWTFALQLAGWPADRAVWTGSAPCQPFSSAGKQKGKADERHLFPTWLNLIRQCRPATIFGEQVASAVAHGWLDDVHQGLEAEGYACGSAVLPACSVGAPHRRDRLYFVAHAEDHRCERGQDAAWQTGRDGAQPDSGKHGDVANANLDDARGRPGEESGAREEIRLRGLPMLASFWPTPQTRDYRSGESHRWADQNRSRNLNDVAATYGEKGFGLTAQTKSIGSLNPAFPCWLMGFSTAALSSMHSAMRSFRKSPRRSSKPA